MAESVYAAYALVCLARLAASTGDEHRCRDHAAHAMTLIEKHHNELGRLYVHSALGLLELGLGRAEPAIQTLECARDLADLHGMAEPNIVHWQPDLVEAYARAGNPAAAREVLAVLDQQAERTGGRWALGTAARCRGLLTDDSSSEDCFDAAVEHLRGGGGAVRDRAYGSLPRRALATRRSGAPPPAGRCGRRSTNSIASAPTPGRTRATDRASSDRRESQAAATVTPIAIS